MKKPQQDIPMNWTNDRSIAARYAPIHDMVTEVLTRTEPDGYAHLVEELRAEWKPAGAEVLIVEIMADLSWRIRGCLYLETEILKRGMEACAGPDVTPDVALGQAYRNDFRGPNLLDKLSRYQSRLSREFSRCLRILRLRAKNRRYAEARMAAQLLRHKPCTSVIQ